MRYRENTEESQMVGEALLDYAIPDDFVTEEYLENDCFTLEESKARLKRVIYNHFHS